MTQPSLRRLPAVGVLAGVVAGLADAVAAVFRDGPMGRAPDFLEAALHLVAFWMPLGWCAGLALGLGVYLWRRTPWSRAARARTGSWARLWTADPSAFAGTLAVSAGGAAYLLAMRVAAEHFATRYHDPALAAWALAVSALVLLGAAAALAAAIRLGILALTRSLSRGPSVGAALLVMLGATLSVGALVVWKARRLFTLYEPAEWLWLPIALGVFALLAWLTRRWRPRVGVALGIAAVAIVASGATYGGRSRVRGVVERRAVTGQMMVRFYGRLTDRDGDGHSFAFGGKDCDDSLAFVYPGAPDSPGDGIDADCFDGDGVTTRVVELGDGHFGELPTGAAHRPNIVLLTIDTLRPDHLGCHGYERPTSPNLDRLCERAVDFTDVVAQSSRSIRSIPAMMTGHYPSQVAYGPEYLWPTLMDENATLAELLGSRSYGTAAVMGTDYFERVDGFYQGFDEVEESPSYRPQRAWPVSRGLRHLDRLADEANPFFLWVHVFNVHEEYLWDRTPSQFGDEPMDEYDTEIRLADDEVGRLVEALEERDLMDDTVLVVASDHGEAFGEHNNRGHSRTLYEEEVRAVLMVLAPGFEPRRVDERVALMDLFPTLANLARIPVERPIAARSLVPLMRGEEVPGDRVIFAELLPDGLYPFDQKALYRGSDKLIWWTREGTHQLFDLEADPGETIDRADDQEERADELNYLLRAWLAQVGRPDNRTNDIIEANRLTELPATMDETLDVDYPGTFRVAGYDIESRSVAPGDHIKMDLYYEVLGETTRDLFFVLDIKGPEGYRVPPHFHAHHYPLNGRYKTFQWRDGEVLRDPVEMVVPRDIRAPVTLSLQLTILDEDMRPIAAQNADGTTVTTIPLGQVAITR